MDRNRLIQFLAEFFSKTPEVELCFLFGSAARDQLKPDSDIDVGLYFTEPPDVFRLHILEAELADLLHREVDLVLLNGQISVLQLG